MATVTPERWTSEYRVVPVVAVPGGDVETAAATELPDSFKPVGTWSGEPAKGGKVVFVLTEDEKFTWKYSSEEENKSFAGDYTLVDNRMLLEDLNVGGLVVRIHPEGADAFILRAEGKPKDDPGVRFERVK